MSGFSSHKSIGVVGVAGLLLGGNVFASGFQITEQSVAGLGRAFAGSGVVGDDASAIFYNPAGMTLRQGSEAQAGISFIASNGEFTNQGSTQTINTPQGPITIPSSGPDANGGTNAYIPNLFFATDVSDRVRIGLGVTAPFGLKTKYGLEWVGRYQALVSDLETIDINPSLAFKATDKLSLGVGFSAQYSDVTLSQAVFVVNPATGQQLPDGLAEVKGNNWGFGYDLGALYEFDPDTRIGASFRSKVKQAVDGERTIEGIPGRSGTVGAQATVTLPETVYVGAFKRLNPQWGVSGTIRWTNWSRFQELRIVSDGSPDAVDQEDWDDTWFFSMGVDYAYRSDLTFRAGYAYDQSPVPNATFRTPRIPDSDRNWLSVGASYRPAPNLTLDFGYSHLFFADANVDRSINLVAAAPGVFTDTLVGEYESSNANIFGIQVNYQF